MTPRTASTPRPPVEDDPADVERDGERDEADAEDGEEDDRPAPAADHLRISDRMTTRSADPRSVRFAFSLRQAAVAKRLWRTALRGPSRPSGRARCRWRRTAFSVIQLMSNSYQARPWRAETGCAWWLLCQPSPKVRSATHQLLRESSRVSKRRVPHMCVAEFTSQVRVQAERRRAGRCPRAPSASRRPRAGSGRAVVSGTQ